MLSKPAKLILTFLFLINTSFSFAQTLQVQKGVALPKDTVISIRLLGSLNGFLAQKDKENKTNSFVLKDDLPETSALLDEFKGMDYNSATKEKGFYKPYLTNLVRLSDDSFIVQLAYTGISNNEPFLRASFRLIAKKSGDKYYFSSPLKMNTAAWKAKKVDNITYYFKTTLPIADAAAFKKKFDADNKRLKIPSQPLQLYYCNNFAEVQQLLGIDFKADYNGAENNILSSHENGGSILVAGYADSLTRIYGHDLWHNRLHSVMAVATINRPVDEGCAYLYGGSWGLSWDTILGMMKKYAAANPNTDWLALYVSSQKLNDGNKPVYIAYVLNALIVQQIENEKGFDAVLPLLSCGKRQQGDDNYFAALEKITGINKMNFDAKMWGLVRAAK